MKNPVIMALYITRFFIYTFLFIVFQVSICFAQNENKKEKKYKWSIAAAINSTEAQVGDPEWDSWYFVKGNFNNGGNTVDKSLSLSIIPKYFISDDILLRFEIGVTNINLTGHYDSQSSSANPSHVIINQNIKQKICRYIPAIQWRFMKKKFIESYMGIAATYLHYNDMHYHLVYEVSDLPGNTVTFRADSKANAQGGFAAGIDALAGFNIYLQKHISFGAEFSSALLYKKIGGAFNGTATYEAVPNPVTSETFSFTSSYEGLKFSKVLPSFNISIWL